MLIYECERCGKCCKVIPWLRDVIKKEDIERWKELDKLDILQYICEGGCLQFVDPEKGGAWRKQECPFLEKDGQLFKCKIYEVHPAGCRQFPYWECGNPECSERWHFADWLWKGNCAAAVKFRKNLVRAVEQDLELLPKVVDWGFKVRTLKR